MSATKPTRREGVVLKDIGGEALLYGADERAIHILNPTARLIWELCDGEHTAEDMTQAIRDRFVVSEEQDVLADVQHTLATLVEKALIQ